MDTEIPYTSTTVHKGDMRCHTTYKEKGSCSTDVAEELGGLGEYPTPGQMLAACVASCMLSMIAHTGHNKGFETEGIRIRAGVEERTRGIAALHFDIEVPMETTAEARRYMKSAVNTCPVGKAVSEGIPKEITWHWGDGEE